MYDHLTNGVVDIGGHIFSEIYNDHGDTGGKVATDFLRRRCTVICEYLHEFSKKIKT
jgi:hypothetical protein